VAPGVLDGSRCLSWLLQRRGSFPEELRGALGARIYGCDDCQEVCPPNRRAPEASVPEPSGGPGAWVPLVELLESDDAHLMDHFGVWYVADRDPRYLRRNALVVLGNVGDGGDPVVERLLVRYLGCGDGLLEEHARWAAQALGRGDLVDATPLAPARASLAGPQASDETGGDGRR
jgi:epoxyqueuosine reductase